MAPIDRHIARPYGGFRCTPCIMDQTGHSTLDFDLKMTPSVKVLMEKFDTLIGWGYRAVGMDRIFWLGIYRRLQATEGSSRFQYVCPDEFRIGSIAPFSSVEP